MPTDSLEPLEPTGQQVSEAPAWGRDPVLPGAVQPEAAAEAARVSPKADKASVAPNGRTSRGSVGISPVVVAFVAGVFGVLLLTIATAFGVSRAYENRILPGVHVGTVDLSGSSRDEAIRKLNNAYSYLGLGDITVVTPGGSDNISYGQVGRSADVNAMVDAAMAVGRDGDPLSSAANTLRSLISGEQVPVVVKVNTVELATRLHDISTASDVAPTNATVTFNGTTFKSTPAAAGKGVDEKTIASWLVDQLASNTAPNALKTDPTYAPIAPAVSDQAANDAIAEAQNMIVDLTVTQGSQSWTIAKAKVQKWIVFGVAADGKYRPAVDPTLIQADVAPLAPKVNVAAVEPTIITDNTGKPVGVANGQNGVTLDVNGTAQAIAAYLDTLAGTPASGPASVAVVTAVTQPRLASNVDLKGFVIIGQHTTVFFPGESNANGANIRVPAKVLNGQVVMPGQIFSFLQSVGPIDTAHGFGMGGVIKDGKSNHTGAMGGGICSASTTMFNAAAKAGLKLVERHQHFYYIDRYPKGLDATVYSNGQTVWDMRWENDTPYPIVIRGIATGGKSQAKVTFQLWSIPTGRTVKFSTPVEANVVKPKSTTIYVSTLKPGNKYVQEYATRGFDTSVTRTVTDSNGNVLYFDRFVSHYGVVNGVLQLGDTPPPPPHTPTPPAAPSTSPAAGSSKRRRGIPIA